MSKYGSSFCSDEELMEELNKLGYDEVSPDVFSMMKDDLAELIDKEEKELTAEYDASELPESSDLIAMSNDSSNEYRSTKETSKKSEKSISRKVKKKSNNNNFQTASEIDSNNQALDNSRGGLSTERRKMKSSNVSLESVDSHHDDISYSEGNYFTKGNQDNNKYSNSRAFKADVNSNDSYECDSDMKKLSLRDDDYHSNYSNTDRLLMNSDIPGNEHTEFYSENRKSYDEVYDLPNSSKTVASNSWRNVKYAFKTFKLKKNFSRVDDELDESAVYNYQGSDLNLNNTHSSSSSETKIMKRKVLRRQNGRSVITEELVELPSKFDTSYPESESLNSSKSFSSDDLSPKSNSSTGSVAAISPESSIKSSPSTLSLLSTRSTSLRVPNMRKKKNDPVAMYNYYRKFWDNFKPPGENKHDRLRWAVRDKMLDYNI